jgi:hypothetical protein
MNVDKLAVPRGKANYYEAGYRVAIETHLPVIRRNIQEHVSITERQKRMYAGDFYGLLSELGVAVPHQWPTLRANGYHSPADFHGEVDTVYTYTPSIFKEILDQYLTTQARL